MIIQICGSDGHHLVLEATNLRMCSARTHSGSQNVEMVGALMLLMISAHVSFAYHCSCRVDYPINPIQYTQQKLDILCTLTIALSILVPAGPQCCGTSDKPRNNAGFVGCIE
jgi:hypothetical protein